MIEKDQYTLDKLTTIEKLKETARAVFMDKGYAATRIRDIANASGVNLAMLNYYFRSKENLFEIVMRENIDRLFELVLPILNNTGTSLEEKMERLSEHYIDMILKEPNLPIFVLNEIQKNPEHFGNQIRFNTSVMESDFIRQLALEDPSCHPVQHLITYLGMLLFPFLMRPVMQATGSIENAHFLSTMQMRKSLAPLWMKSVLSSSRK